jgi:predicted nucleic acid-binding protein
MVILDSIKMDIHEVEATLGTLVLRKNTNENSVHINMIMNNPEKNKAIETDVLDGVFNEVNKETDRRIADATQLIVNARKRRNIIHNSSEHLYQNLVVS